MDERARRMEEGRPFLSQASTENEYCIQYSVQEICPARVPLSIVSLGVKNIGNGWSKSIVLENKVFFNFDFRHGAKKSGQSGHSFRKLWLSLNLAVKEQNERVYKCGRSCNFFCRSCKFSFS